MSKAIAVLALTAVTLVAACAEGTQTRTTTQATVTDPAPVAMP